MVCGFLMISLKKHILKISKRHPRFFSNFQDMFFKDFIKNPQTTNALTFLTHIISGIEGVASTFGKNIKLRPLNKHNKLIDISGTLACGHGFFSIIYIFQPVLHQLSSNFVIKPSKVSKWKNMQNGILLFLLDLPHGLVIY